MAVPVVYQGCPDCGVAHCPHAYRPARQRRPWTRQDTISLVMTLAVAAVLLGGTPAVKPAVDAIREAVTPKQPPPAPPTVAWSPAAKAEIPGPIQVLYIKAANECPALSPFLLAGIGRVESNHGKSDAPGVKSGLNAFGCCAGPMQFNLVNGPPSTWDAFGGDYNHDGQANPHDPGDAIPAAAKKLCANGLQPTEDNRRWNGHLDADPCPDQRGTPAAHRALRRYNNACWYVAEVIQHGLRYAHEGQGVT